MVRCPGNVASINGFMGSHCTECPVLTPRLSTRWSASSSLLVERFSAKARKVRVGGT